MMLVTEALEVVAGLFVAVALEVICGTVGDCGCRSRPPLSAVRGREEERSTRAGSKSIYVSSTLVRPQFLLFEGQSCD